MRTLVIVLATLLTACGREPLSPAVVPPGHYELFMRNGRRAPTDITFQQPAGSPRITAVIDGDLVLGSASQYTLTLDVAIEGQPAPVTLRVAQGRYVVRIRTLHLRDANGRPLYTGAFTESGTGVIVNAGPALGSLLFAKNVE